MSVGVAQRGECECGGSTEGSVVIAQRWECGEWHRTSG